MSESNSSQRSTEQVKRSNRLQLIVIVLIAVISLGGSYLLFFSARDGAVWGTTNNGEWVRPTVSVAELELQDASGSTVAPEPLWWVWVVSDGACDANCDEAVFKMRQLHVLLNKEADRVRRALIAPDALTVQLREEYPKLARWNQTQESPRDLTPGIYLVDPLGNLVFRYALDTVGKPVLSDLKRLLKVSQIG